MIRGQNFEYLWMKCDQNFESTSLIFFSQTRRVTHIVVLRRRKRGNKCPGIEKDTTHKPTPWRHTHSSGQEGTRKWSGRYLASTIHPTTKLHSDPLVRGIGTAEATRVAPPPSPLRTTTKKLYPPTCTSCNVSAIPTNMYVMPTLHRLCDSRLAERGRRADNDAISGGGAARASQASPSHAPAAPISATGTGGGKGVPSPPRLPHPSRSHHSAVEGR
jgi:hypothetical protein